MKVLLIDNYDSFTYNLVHYLEEISPDVDVEVVRNDALTVKEALAKGADAVVLSPGP
jgi:anthranilate synthase component 2